MVTGTGVVSSLTITIQQLLKRLIITSASWQISNINLVYCGDPPSTELRRSCGIGHEETCFMSMIQ